MPELRIDPVSGRQVLMAPDRSQRPVHLRVEPTASRTEGRLAADEARAACPFCAGRESQTPPAAFEATDEAGAWQVRVVPNLYPAISAPLGAHEVVIESPQHVTDWHAMSPAELTRVVLTYRDRLRAHQEHARAAYVSVFKNAGAEAGASLPHVHSQILRASGGSGRSPGGTQRRREALPRNPHLPLLPVGGGRAPRRRPNGHRYRADLRMDRVRRPASGRNVVCPATAPGTV